MNQCFKASAHTKTSLSILIFSFPYNILNNIKRDYMNVYAV